MLQFAPRTFVHPKSPLRHIVLTARNIALATRGSRERAYLAANWVCGSLTIVNPTVKLASYVFDVSIPTIRTAVTDLKTMTSDSDPTRVEEIWSRMTPAERDAFARRHLNELWLIFDHATAA